MHLLKPGTGRITSAKRAVVCYCVKQFGMPYHIAVPLIGWGDSGIHCRHANPPTNPQPDERLYFGFDPTPNLLLFHWPSLGPCSIRSAALSDAAIRPDLCFHPRPSADTYTTRSRSCAALTDLRSADADVLLFRLGRIRARRNAVGVNQSSIGSGYAVPDIKLG